MKNIDTRKAVIRRTPVEVAEIHEGGGLHRHHWKFTVTLEDGSTREYHGIRGTESKAMNQAIRFSGKLIEKGVE